MSSPRSKFYILLEGQPMPVSDVLEWEQWFETSHAERVVKQEWVGRYWVSTVFLGLDHNYGLSGPPLIYETMICLKGRPQEGRSCERYSTLEQARLGHQRAVDDLQEQESTRH